MKCPRFDALPALVFPVILAGGILTIPVVADYSDHTLAEEAASQATRWFWGHLVSGIAFGIAIAAAHSIKVYLSMKGRRCTAR